jgi:hypothetical protein
MALRNLADSGERLRPRYGARFTTGDERRGHGFFLPMDSMMNILAEQPLLISDVRQNGAGPERQRTRALHIHPGHSLSKASCVALRQNDVNG